MDKQRIVDQMFWAAGVTRGAADGEPGAVRDNLLQLSRMLLWNAVELSLHYQMDYHFIAPDWL